MSPPEAEALGHADVLGGHCFLFGFARYTVGEPGSALALLQQDEQINLQRLGEALC